MNRFCLVAVLVLSSVVPVRAQGVDLATRDLTVEQKAAFKAGSNKISSLKLVASVDRADKVYQKGDTLTISVKVDQDAYVTILNIGPKGKVTQLFPNKFQTDNRIKPKSETVVPSKESNAEIKITGDLGGELIQIVASDKPTKIGTDVASSSPNTFATLDGGVPGLVRDFEAVEKGKEAPAKLSIVNLALKTVEKR